MIRRIHRILHNKHAGQLAMAGGVAIFAVIVIIVGLLAASNTITPHSVQPTPMPSVKASTTESLIKTTTPTPQPAPLIHVQVRAYTIEGRMADGKLTHSGACAVSTAQFPLGTILNLYNADGSFNRQCLAEDTGSDVQYGQIDLAMPGDTAGATRWGVRSLLARVVRWGWGKK